MMTNKLIQRFLLIATVLLCVLSVQAQQGALLLYEVGTVNSANASAGAGATHHDASAAFYNPSSITEVDQRNTVLGFHGLQTVIKYESDNTEVYPEQVSAGGFIPSIAGYWSKQLNNKWAVATFLNAPSGAGTHYGNSWEGRGHIDNNMMAILNIAPTVAYRFNEKLSFGASVNINPGVLTQDITIDAALNNRYEDVPLNDHVIADVTVDVLSSGNLHLSGLGFGAGFTFGAQYRPSDKTTVGLMYRYQSKVKFNTTASLDAGTDATIGIDATVGRLPVQKDTTVYADLDIDDVETDIDILLPHGLNLSVSHRLNQKWELLADLGFTNWKAFDEMPITVTFDELDEPIEASMHRGWKNTWRVGAGANYYTKSWIIRGGISYDSEPAEGENFTADMPVSKAWRYSTGVSKSINNKELSIGYTWLRSPSKDIYNLDGHGNVEPIKSGTYTSLGIHAMNVTYAF